MNLIIITCPHLASIRLPKVMFQIKNAIAKGLISAIKIICPKDEDLWVANDIPYNYLHWQNDIRIAWAVFSQNIVTSGGYRDNTGLRQVSHYLNPSTCFPPRLLSDSEHSIALRHILAIKTISMLDHPCLVLEDDVIVRDENMFCYLLGALTANCKDRVFYDLCDNYIPISATKAKPFYDGPLRYSINEIAITRTLMAYAISPRTARIILDSFHHYSLPIDMQIQVILSSMSMPGLSLISSPFVHGSKTGAFSSSIL